jgi:hypothetical protein
VRTPSDGVIFSDRSIIRNLTIAVLPKDDFIGQKPIGRLKVFVKELEDHIPIINKSGYYVFLDINNKLEDDHSLVIESEEKFYFRKSITIREIKQLQDLKTNPAIEISLIPNASYPFSDGVSLGRGTVLTEQLGGGGREEENSILLRKPVLGAKVELKDRDLTYTTEKNGDFLFYFKNLKEEDIIEKDEKKFIRMGNDTETDLIVTCPGFIDFKKSGCEFEVGKTAVFTVILLKEG